MHIVLLFPHEKKQMKKFRNINREYRKPWLRVTFIFALFWPLIDVLTAFCIGLILWLGGVFTLVGSRVTVGVVIAFVQFPQQLFNPISQIALRLRNLQTASAGAERIVEILEIDHALKEPDQTAPVHLTGHIEFRDVWFSYTDDETNWVLENISFEIFPGQRVEIVGLSGSGKITIINLLMRFDDIQKGQILVDGRDIRTYKIGYLRWHIGMVLQDVFFFSDRWRRISLWGTPGSRWITSYGRQKSSALRVYRTVARQLSPRPERTGQIPFFW